MRWDLQDKKETATKSVQNPPPILGVQHALKSEPPPQKKKIKTLRFKRTYRKDEDDHVTTLWVADSGTHWLADDYVLRHFYVLENHYRNRSKRYKIESGYILGTRFYPGERFFGPWFYPYSCHICQRPHKWIPFCIFWCTLWQTILYNPISSEIYEYHTKCYWELCRKLEVGVGSTEQRRSGII